MSGSPVESNSLKIQSPCGKRGQGEHLDQPAAESGCIPRFHYGKKNPKSPHGDIEVDASPCAKERALEDGGGWGRIEAHPQAVHASSAPESLMTNEGAIKRPGRSYASGALCDLVDGERCCK